MKKLETVVKALETVDNATLETIINNRDDVDVTLLTDDEKLSVLVYAELAKALETKAYKLVLNCNYKQSKSATIDMKYFRLVSNDTKNQSMIQVYAKINARKASVYFDICTSCALRNREQFEALTDLQCTIKRDKQNRAKTTERKHIAYDELVNVIKSVCAVLANEAQSAQSEATAERSEAKKREKTR